VYDPCVVGRIERGSRLLQPLQRFARRLGSSADDIVERAARQVFHYEERPPVPLAHVEDRDDVRLA